jgi:hypothetical protein
MEDLSPGIVFLLGPSATPRLVHALHARVVRLMVCLVRRESQARGRSKRSKKDEDKASPPLAQAQVRFDRRSDSEAQSVVLGVISRIIVDTFIYRVCAGGGGRAAGDLRRAAGPQEQGEGAATGTSDLNAWSSAYRETYGTD